jgi:anti-anti-sigma factor
MIYSTGIFEVDRLGGVFVLEPQQDLHELDCREIAAEGEEVLRLASDPSVEGVVVDFGRTDAFGSSALELLVRLWRRMRDRDGCMALCNVSDHENEILEATGLADFWPVYPSRAEAVEAMGGGVPALC